MLLMWYDDMIQVHTLELSVFITLDSGQFARSGPEHWVRFYAAG